MQKHNWILYINLYTENLLAWIINSGIYFVHPLDFLHKGSHCLNGCWILSNAFTASGEMFQFVNRWTTATFRNKSYLVIMHYLFYIWLNLVNILFKVFVSLFMSYWPLIGSFLQILLIKDDVHFMIWVGKQSLLSNFLDKQVVWHWYNFFFKCLEN